MADPIALVVTTLGDEASADALARRLIEDRLAACAQVVQVRSTYHWQGQLEQAEEWRLEAKTTTDLAARLAEAIAAGHPYELPEVLTIGCLAEPRYAQWVARECRGDDA